MNNQEDKSEKVVNKVSSFIKNIAFGSVIFVVTLGISLLAAEYYFRKQNPDFKKPDIESASTHAQFNHKYGIEPKPNAEYIEFDITVQTNSSAMFGPEINEAKNSIRILHLGDSYNSGPGIKYESNYPHLIEKKLEPTFGEIETLIGGMGGSSPMQQLHIFEKKLLKFEPDVVIYELYHNDLRDDFVFYYSPYLTRINIANKLPNRAKNSALITKLVELYLQKADPTKEKLYLDQAKFMPSTLTENPTPDEPPREEIFSFMENSWQTHTEPALTSILQLSNSIGAKFVIFYIPQGWEFENEYQADTPPHVKSIIGPNIKKWAEKNQVPFVDLTSTFGELNTEALNEFYLPGEKGYHLTEKGASIAAELVTPLVAQELNQQ